MLFRVVVFVKYCVLKSAFSVIEKLKLRNEIYIINENAQ